jgi:hypothetical protein
MILFFIVHAVEYPGENQQETNDDDQKLHDDKLMQS